MEQNSFPHEEYLETEIKLFEEDQHNRLNAVIKETASIDIENVIDVGCGAGQELLPFVQMENVTCVGVDVSNTSGKVFNQFFEEKDIPSRPVFIQSKGEQLPFESEKFDLVICRVALPYMNNRKALKEMARVLRPGGRLLLRTHSPQFYFGMVARRLKDFSLKSLAYPILCFTGGVWHWLVGKRMNIGLLKNKEVFQTTGTIKRDIRETGLVIKNERKSRCGEAKAFVLEKISLCNLIAHYFLESDMLFLGLSVIH